MNLDILVDTIIDELYDILNINNFRLKLKYKVREIIYEAIESTPPFKRKIGVYGVGEHTDKLLELVDINDITLFIDSDHYNTFYLEKPVVSPTDSRIQDLDCIILSSYAYTLDMEHILYEKSHYKNKIINIYDILEEQGAFLQTSYYNIPYYSYKKINILLNRYEKQSITEEKRIILAKLILYSLENRDFSSAIRYLNKYINHKHKNYKIVQEKKEELTALFQSIKTRIASKNLKHIVINWIDALGDSVENMPFLQSELKESAFFENSFTVIPFTTSVLETLHYGELNIDEKLFQKHPFKNTPLITLIEQYGYEFKYVLANHRTCFFYPENIIAPHRTTYDEEQPSTLVQWETLKAMYESSKPLVLLVHNLAETHEPYASPCNEYGTYPELDKLLNKEDGIAIVKQGILKSNCFLDEQLKWYTDFIPISATKIYMSDHGRGRGFYHHGFEDCRSKILFSIVKKEISPVCYHNLFSLKEFIKVLQHLFTGNYDFNDICSDYIFLQNYDVYSNELIYLVYFLNMDSYLELQYRGIRTQSEKYIHYVDGSEFYFLLPDEEHNLIDNNVYKERIQELRNLAGNKFIDVYTEDKFIHSRLTYKIMGVTPESKSTLNEECE